MRDWQYNVLFGITAAGSIFLLFAKKLGVDLDPTALTGYGAIVTYVLTQHWSRSSRNGNEKDSEGKHKDASGDRS